MWWLSALTTLHFIHPCDVPDTTDLGRDRRSEFRGPIHAKDPVNTDTNEAVISVFVGIVAGWPIQLAATYLPDLLGLSEDLLDPEIPAVPRKGRLYIPQAESSPDTVEQIRHEKTQKTQTNTT
jgi:hypothetical protein